jgi:hypothetical protein
MSSQEGVARPVVKSTYSNLSEAILGTSASAAIGDSEAMAGLIDVLHLSPRLPQWALVDGGGAYRIWTANDAASVTVTSNEVYLTKGSRRFNLQKGLPASTLYEAIQTAQAIVQPRQPSDMSEEEQAEFFAPDPSAATPDLDAALADPEDALEIAVAEGADQLVPDPEEHYSERANQKNTKTDGVICQYCGNLNKQTYRGPCPQCPGKLSKQAVSENATATWAPMQVEIVKSQSGKGMISESYATKRVKSLQGRVLTIVDACFSDKTQRENVKTLINKEFRREIGKLGAGELEQFLDEE